MTVFDYRTAFSRTVGWITSAELEKLRHSRVAIAGLGGVGGSHFLTLTRLGIGAFNVADFDTFDLVNFNRQAGANIATLGRSKAEVLTEMAKAINPEIDVRVFGEGVNASNMDHFLDGTDAYVDGLDFFVLDVRRAVFAACAKKGIPATTVAPLGMGAALLNFVPGGMTFEDYFQLEDHSEDEQFLRFLLGLSPAMLQGAYLVDPTAVDFARRRGPSTPMACELCAGLAATQVLKMLLRRGPIVAAPWGWHMDAYRNRCVRTWRPGGNRNPLQRLGLAIARKKFGAQRAELAAVTPAQSPATTLEQILDVARWAPSGDNNQPWRFEIASDTHVVIHGRDTRDHCVYDLRGRATQIALGALLETLAIAASAHGLRAEATRRTDAPEHTPTFDVRIVADTAVIAHPLLPYVTARSTQRRRLSAEPLLEAERAALETAPGEGYRVVWIDTPPAKRRMAGLLFRNAGIRLTIPEAYEVHRAVIDWRKRYSADRIPDQAVGLDPIATRLMEWTLKSWDRVRFFNRYLAGTWLPRIQLDVIPALGCAAHFIIVAERAPATIDDYVEAGRAVQRFWLTATQRGIQLQPEMTPLIFSSYVRENVTFTGQEAAEHSAKALARDLSALIGAEALTHAVFMGRVGYGPAPQARSMRLPLQELMIKPA